MAKVSEDYKLQKAIKKLQDAVAELHRLGHVPMWPEQQEELKKAVFDLEEWMSDNQGLFLKPTNR